jgi:RNA polymerase-binding transcription factor DksA
MSMGGPTQGERSVPVIAERVPEPDAVPGIEQYQMLLHAAEQLLDGVDRALTRLDEGTYGTCEVCGAALDDHALEEDPLRVRCAAHHAP